MKIFGDDISFDFEKMHQLPKKYFKWNNTDILDNNKHIGTSAQELKKIYPNLVNKSKDGTYVVDYSALNVVALKGIDLLCEALG